MDTTRLEGKNVLVTGAAQGMGAAVAEHYAAQGASVCVGDLNVDEYHFGRLGQLPGIAHAITGTTTNTRRNKSYDNLVFDARTTGEYTGRFGVLDLMAEYQLTEAQALDVSDHLPVWAEFTAREAAGGARVATRPEAGVPAGSR